MASIPSPDYRVFDVVRPGGRGPLNSELYPDLKFTHGVKETKLSSDIWSDLKLVNPAVGEEFENYNEFREALRDGAALLRSEAALKRLANAFGDVVVFNVLDLDGTFDEANPQDFGTPNEADDEEEEDDE